MRLHSHLRLTKPKGSDGCDFLLAISSLSSYTPMRVSLKQDTMLANVCDFCIQTAWDFTPLAEGRGVPKLDRDMFCRRHHSHLRLPKPKVSDGCNFLLAISPVISPSRASLKQDMILANVGEFCILTAWEFAPLVGGRGASKVEFECAHVLFSLKHLRTLVWRQPWKLQVLINFQY